MSAVVRHVVAASIASLCIPAITGGELLFGLAKHLDAVRLHVAVGEFLRRADMLPWDADAAKRYGSVRARMERRGAILAPLDLLIARHALSTGAVLVTNDVAFLWVDDLDVEDWDGPRVWLDAGSEIALVLNLAARYRVPA